MKEGAIVRDWSCLLCVGLIGIVPTERATAAEDAEEGRMPSSHEQLLVFEPGSLTVAAALRKGKVHLSGLETFFCS